MHFVYIIVSKNKKFTYVGKTTKLKRRICEHNRGEVKSSKAFVPLKLLFFCCFTSKYKATDFEKYLKTGSGKAFTKRHLI